ncbi:50S ribosomal protein L11 methyltransferase [Actinokineospora diospyrosa]|uniref:Protein arginine N-methyltransferase 1 n=1 Tax=Actinokineospora diospyrosa TaxID=103728 RepID=A0ABT1INY8_9PSEU|nr:50S ribosomal protein L11 methyltransferase [Actinokineospora diospyrosa]MCP2274391.1 protein arginine N-methyltransferase 1 [Actinokineospora diospyrosa]
MDTRTLVMHQAMLGDRTRLRAYDDALAWAVRPGDVVIDVGAGLLVLGMLALKHGASHVYAIEGDPVTAAVAASIAEDNGLSGKLTVIHGDARTVELPRQADVIVSELMGNIGPEEEMPEIIAAVARRALAPGGRVVPQRLTTTLTAIEFDDEGWGVWSGDALGYRLDAVQGFVQPAAHLHFFQRPPTRLSAAVPIGDSVLGATETGVSTAPRKLRITRPGTLHAVMGSFTATLAPGVTLSNFPSYPGCNWGVWIWPLRHTPVIDGDVLQARVVLPEGVRVATDWQLECGISRRGAS